MGEKAENKREEFEEVKREEGSKGKRCRDWWHVGKGMGVG